MKIAMFTDSYSQVNGVSMHVKAVVPALIKQGAEVTVYTGRGNSSKYTVVNMPHFPFPFERDYDVICSFKPKADVDIIHAHTPFCAGWAGVRSGKPSVSTTHTAPSHLLSMYRMNFLEPLGWWYLASFHNHTDHVVSQTKSTAERFQRHGVKRPFSIVSAGIDFKRFSKGDSEAFRDEYDVPDEFVLSTNRLSPEKRPEFTLKACRELGIPLVLTSTGPMKERLEKEYPEARFLGFVPHDLLPGAYAAASVFVLPSLDETEGLVVSEAMAAKTPVVCTSLPCLRDAVKDGANGFLFNTYGEFRDKLEMLWNDKKLRAAIAAKAVKTAEERDINKSAANLMKVYERVISES